MKLFMATAIATLLVLAQVNGSFKKHVTIPTVHCHEYHLETDRLAHKLWKVKEKHSLLCKDFGDLYETCKIIVLYNKRQLRTNYTVEEIASIVTVESRFNQFALNKADGGKGLTQVMSRSWKKDFPWYTNPYDKEQSIRACYAVLDKLTLEHGKNKALVFKRYNGDGPKAERYSKIILALSREYKQIEIA